MRGICGIAARMLLLVAVLAPPCAVCSAAEGVAEKGKAVGNWNDPAFGMYIDLSLLRQAWEEMDAGALTDAALQLAEGERILLRPHKAMSSAQMAEVALKVAIMRKDKATLERLARMAEKFANKGLSEGVAQAKRLIGVSRAVDPALIVSVEQMTPEALAAYQEFLQAISQARLAGRKDELAEIEKSLPDFTELTAKHRDYLKKQIEEARTAMPDKPDPNIEAILKLSDESRRGGGHGGGRGGFSGGRGGHMGGRAAHVGGYGGKSASKGGGKSAYKGGGKSAYKGGGKQARYAKAAAAKHYKHAKSYWRRHWHPRFNRWVWWDPFCSCYYWYNDNDYTYYQVEEEEEEGE